MREILFQTDLQQRLRLSRSTFYRVLKSRALDFAELPRLDRRRRWSAALIDQWIATARRPLRRIA